MVSLQTVTAFMTGHDCSCLTPQNADRMVLRYSHQTHFTYVVCAPEMYANKHDIHRCQDIGYMIRL